MSDDNWRMSLEAYPQFLAVIFALVLSATAVAAENVVRPSIEWLPTTLDLAGASKVRADVLLHNYTDETLYGVRLFAFNNCGVTVMWNDSQLTVRPKTTARWSVSVVRGADTLLPGTVQLEVSYGTAPSRKPDQVVVGSLKLTDSGADQIDKFASLSLEASAGALTDYRRQEAYLQIANNSNHEVTATVTWMGPQFVKVIPEEGAGVTIVAETSAGAKSHDSPATSVEVSMLAHDKIVVPFALQLEGAIEPGKQKLMFETRFNWQSGGHPRDGTLFFPYEVTSNILGESGVLQLLGIPSFLVLPGALLLMVVAALRKQGWMIPQESGKVSIPSDVKTPDFWVWAITLSILAGIIFYVIKGRTYLSGYSTRDMLQVWGGTIFVGVFGYAAVAVSRTAYLKHEASVTPSEKDVALDVLNKLIRTRQGLKLPVLELTKEGQKYTRYLFGDRKERSTYWVLPQIAVQWELNAPTKLQQAVDVAINDGKTQDLVRSLQSGTDAGVLQVRWSDADGFRQPYPAKSGEIHFTGEGGNVVKRT
jgi:hypothetical protein